MNKPRAAATLLALLLPGIAALGNASPSRIDERFGTWTTNDEVEFQKVVWDIHGYRKYRHLSDQRPFVEGTSQIAARWKDAEGNTWFKLFDTVIKGPYEGMRFETVLKVSKSGSQQELVYHPVDEFDFREGFPCHGYE